MLRFVLRTMLGVTIGALGLAACGLDRTAFAQTAKPNILLFILDDVGIDQLALFNNGGLLPPVTPNIGLLAHAGVKFTNMWAMPECSPTRATIFTGRYPIHTGVEAAIMENHLPQSYMSSFEATLPRVLTKAGYTNALFGKYHLGNEQDPAGNCVPSTRGWQAFSGAMTAGPPSIDKTAGTVDPSGSQVCGYFQTTAPGSCYTASGNSLLCTPIFSDTADPGTDPARTCLQHGGIFVPNQTCGVNAPPVSAFSRTNGYYVWPRTTLNGVRDPLFTGSCSSVIDRTYLTLAQSNDGINWWKQQTGPRMLTISYNAMHTPIQKAPTSIVPDPLDNPATCSGSQPKRTELNSMIEAIDVEVGRTLAALGLGTLAADGRTLVSLNLDNTVIVVLGDNGSQGPAVRIESGFDPTRAKTTVYQTGVWVPMVIAGSPVVVPNREVSELVNAADLFQLFGDLAGIKVGEIVPPSHVLDSMPLLPYLTNPATLPIRTTNFTQEGVANFSPVPSERSWPCQINNFCNDTLFNSKDFCEDNGGTWWGPGGARQANSCCAVGAALGTNLSIAPAHQSAVRSKFYKLVELQTPNCSAPITDPSQKAYPWADYQTRTTEEFYDIRSTSINPKGIDFAPLNLAKNCAPGQDLTTCLPTQIDVDNYKPLKAELQRVKNSAAAQNSCQAKGDGNLDMRVTAADIQGWAAFSGKGPSRYDVNLDGQTDTADLAIIQANLGVDCLNACTRADLNRDGKVDAADMALLTSQTGRCTDAIFCSGDLDGDGKVDDRDVVLMSSQQGSTCTAADATSIVTAVAPAARTTTVGSTVTGFATVINSGSAAATSCSIALPAGVPANFLYQTTDASTNTPIGTPDTPVNIGVAAAQTFYFAVTPTAAFSTDIALVFDCANTGPAAVVPGLNTFLLTASETAIPDMLSISDTLTHNGKIDIAGTGGTGLMAVAAVNIGAAGTVTFTPADTAVGQASKNLPLTLTICQTDPSNGICINPPTPGASSTVTVVPNQTVSFSIFVTGQGQAVPYDPANNRIFSIATQNSTPVGETSAAVNMH